MFFWKQCAREQEGPHERLHTLSPLRREIKVIAFISDNDVMDRIISHLELRFLVAKPPPFHFFSEVALMAAEAGVEYFKSRLYVTAIFARHQGLSPFGQFLGLCRIIVSPNGNIRGVFFILDTHLRPEIRFR